MKNVLLFGAAGQLGSLVAKAAPDSVRLHAFSRDSLDLSDEGALQAAVETTSPDALINCAAYTAVDRAEAEKETAYRINDRAVASLASVVPAETRIIHISTDFVFSKRSDHPYLPEDETVPVSVYGQSKLAGEKALLSARPETTVILRTSWLYAAHAGNFVTTMLRLMRTREALDVVNDQFGSPTSAHTLAEIIWLFIANDAARGIYHWSDAGVITWYDFAVEILRQARELGLLEKEVPINPVPSEVFPTAAKRPDYSALDSSKTENLLGIRARPWQDQLNKVLGLILESTN